MALVDEGKPYRAALRWQVYATAASVLLATLWLGLHGALSALLGGLINVTAGAVYGLVATRSKKRMPSEILRALFRAEAAKVALIVVQLALVLTHYKHIVPSIFFATFILTVVLFSMAINSVTTTKGA